MRLQRIDAFRVYSTLLIVFAHTQYFGGVDLSLPFTKAFSIAIVTIARSTIQFYFIVSGFFLGGKIIESPGQAIPMAWKYTWRLLIVFVSWSILYGLAQPQGFLLLLERDPLRLIFEGTKVHLWYLPSLILTIWLFALWPFDRKSWQFLAFGGVLFIVGMLGGAYKATDIGINLHFNTRDGIFFSTLFFGIGAYFHHKRPQVGKAAALGIYLFGLALFALESWYLWSQWEMDPIKNDYVFGSVAYGIGAFLIAYLFRENRLDRMVAPYAKYVLGIYVSHLFVLETLKRYNHLVNPILWQLLLPIVVFFFTLLCMALIARTPFRRVIGIE